MNSKIILMLITNDPKVASLAEKAGIDWIFVDLEILGKKERQKNRDTLISNHNIEDIKAVKKVLVKSKLLVRINPININSESEIEKVISYGADIIMLPFFSTINEILLFIKFVKNRSKTCLLVETISAHNLLSDICRIGNIDFIHIGLNDLHIQLNMKFMFQLLSEGFLDKSSKIITKSKIIFGFGGLASLEKGVVPGKYILEEHKRLNSSMVILSRSFVDKNKYKTFLSFSKKFKSEVKKIRSYEYFLTKKNKKYFILQHQKTLSLINNYIKNYEKE